jgi:hypothetical protein
MMRNAIPFLLLLLIPLFNAPAQVDIAGDSARVVILSDSVGAVLSGEDQARYHLFKQIGEVRQCVVLRLRDTAFALWVSFPQGSGRPDALLRTPEREVLAMAELIDHARELEEGAYALGTTAPDIVITGIVLVPARQSLTQAVAALQQDPITRAHRHPGHAADERLPLAAAHGVIVPRVHRGLTIAVGFRTSQLDLSGLANLMGEVPNSNFSPMYELVPEYLITDEIGIQANASVGGGLCYSAGVTLVLYAHPFPEPSVRPFLEGGYTWMYFEGSTSFFKFDASAGGVRFGAGIELLAGNRIGFAVDLCYENMGRVSSIFPFGRQVSDGTGGVTWVPVPVSVNFSGLQFGGRIIF